MDSPPPPYILHEPARMTDPDPQQPYHHEPIIPFVAGSTSTASPLLPAPALAPVNADAVQRIQAYARLEFVEGIDFYIRTLAVTIGRRPLSPGNKEEKAEQHGQPAIQRSPLLRPVSDARSSPPVLDGLLAEPKKEQTSLLDVHPTPPMQVDVDLGPIKAVSRDHARLAYDYKSTEWVLEVRGRNGVVVDGHWHSKGESVAMHHGTKIQIAERVFHFMLPAQPLTSGSVEEDDASMTDYTSDESVPHPAAVVTFKGVRGKPIGRGRGGVSSRGRNLKAERGDKVPTRKKLPARSNRGKGKAKDDYYQDSLLPEAERLRSVANPGPGSAPSVKVKLPPPPPKPLRFPDNEYVGKPDKPPYTMTSLIAQAIMHHDAEKATLNQVVVWIRAAYPFYAKDSGLQIDIDRRLRDARFFAPIKSNTYTVLVDESQPQYFDGTVFRKRAQPAVAKVVETAPAVPASPPTLPPPALADGWLTSGSSSAAPLPIIVEALPTDYDPATAPLVPGLEEPPIAIHRGQMLLSPSVFKHLLKDTTKLDTLRKMPTDKAIAALRQFVVAYLKAKAAKAEKRKAEEGGEPEAKVSKV